MNRLTITNRLDQIIERLAAIEHQRWSHWQKYVHDQGAKIEDGSLLIPAALVGRWDKQIATPYEMLSENEKESDREQVRKYLPTVIEALAPITD